MRRAALRIGTRASALALWQARHVSAAIAHQSDAPAIEPPVATSATDTTATDAPVTSAGDAPVTSLGDASAIPTTPEPSIPETFTAADAHAAALEPLAITREVQPLPAPQDITPAAPDVLKDAKAS